MGKTECKTRSGSKSGTTVANAGRINGRCQCTWVDYRIPKRVDQRAFPAPRQHRSAASLLASAPLFSGFSSLRPPAAI